MRHPVDVDEGDQRRIVPIEPGEEAIDHPLVLSLHGRSLDIDLAEARGDRLGLDLCGEDGAPLLPADIVADLAGGDGGEHGLRVVHAAVPLDLLTQRHKDLLVEITGGLGADVAAGEPLVNEPGVLAIEGVHHGARARGHGSGEVAALRCWRVAVLVEGKGVKVVHGGEMDGGAGDFFIGKKKMGTGDHGTGARINIPEGRGNVQEAGVPAMDTRLHAMDARLHAIDARLLNMDAGFRNMDAGFRNMDARLHDMDARLHDMDAGSHEIGLASMTWTPAPMRSAWRPMTWTPAPMRSAWLP